MYVAHTSAPDSTDAFLEGLKEPHEEPHEFKTSDWDREPAEPTSLTQILMGAKNANQQAYAYRRTNAYAKSLSSMSYGKIGTTTHHWYTRAKP